MAPNRISHGANSQSTANGAYGSHQRSNRRRTWGKVNLLVADWVYHLTVRTDPSCFTTRPVPKVCRMTRLDRPMLSG